MILGENIVAKLNFVKALDLLRTMKINSANYELASVSDYDGETTATFVCPRCHLSVGENYRTDRPYCKACKNLDLYLALDQATKSLVSPGLITAAFIFFISLNSAFKQLRILIVPLLIIIFLPSLLANMFLVKIHARKIPSKEQTMLYLKSYNFFGKSSLYNHALQIWRKNSVLASETLKKNVVRKLLEYVILKDAANPNAWIKNWAEAYNMDQSEFITYMYEVAEDQINKAIAPSATYGTLSDFWEIMKDLDIRETFIDSIASYVTELDTYDLFEQKIFTEELYVLEDELVPIIEAHGKQEWLKIKEVIDAFVPDEVPDNAMKAIMAISKHKQQFQEYYSRTKGATAKVDTTVDIENPTNIPIEE